MTLDSILAILAQFLNSFQLRGILGLILLDLVLGIAAAFKVGKFDWEKVAAFYKSSIVPYIMGYGTLYIAIYLILPPQLTATSLPDGIVTLAWGFLVMTLVGSVWSSLRILYPVLPPPPLTGPAVPAPKMTSALEDRTAVMPVNVTTITNGATVPMSVTAPH